MAFQLHVLLGGVNPDQYLHDVALALRVKAKHGACHPLARFVKEMALLDDRVRVLFSSCFLALLLAQLPAGGSAPGRSGSWSADVPSQQPAKRVAATSNTTELQSMAEGAMRFVPQRKHMGHDIYHHRASQQ
jgi:hypothetical protein